MSEVFERIKQEIAHNDVVVYMKGTAKMPTCGFSATVVGVLNQLHAPFKDVDVLQDPDLRQGIKDFSSWPTIPQIYVKGEFIGGCDIIREMYQNGELLALLRSKGIVS